MFVATPAEGFNRVEETLWIIFSGITCDFLCCIRTVGSFSSEPCERNGSEEEKREKLLFEPALYFLSSVLRLFISVFVVSTEKSSCVCVWCVCVRVCVPACEGVCVFATYFLRWKTKVPFYVQSICFCPSDASSCVLSQETFRIMVN